LKRLTASFFHRDVLEVAPQLLGKTIVRKFDTGETKQYLITETEAYRGEEDLACHASKGRTSRTEIMYQPGGYVYVYLIYGMYWLLNFTTNPNSFPAAVLIRGVENFSGPGRVGRELQLNQTFYGENLVESERIWVVDNNFNPPVEVSKRIGVNYSGPWANLLWRFTIGNYK